MNVFKTFLGSVLLFLSLGSLSAQEISKVSIVELDSMIHSSKQPIVVSFWATWCTPCLHEIPWLEAAVNAHASSGVELYLVSLNGPGFYPDKLRRFIIEKGYKARLFWLEDQDAHYYGKKIHPRWRGSLPANLFVNNARGYRKFLERQVTDRQAFSEIAAMLQ